MKRQVTVLQKISANHKSDKGLVSTIYKESAKLNSERQKSMKKWSKDTDTSPKKIDRWQIMHMKRCSKSLAIRELQLKITMRYHYTHI